MVDFFSSLIDIGSGLDSVFRGQTLDFFICSWMSTCKSATVGQDSHILDCNNSLEFVHIRVQHIHMDHIIWFHT